MNKHLANSLIKQAGFVFWQDEPWQPEAAVVDWSSNYDRELLELIQLVVRRCAQTAHVNHLTGDYYTGRRDAAQLVLKQWDLEPK